MSFRRKVVVAAALAFLFWGFGRAASTDEPRDKPLPPFAKFARGLFSGYQDPDPTSTTEEVFEKPVVKTYTESTHTGSSQGISEYPQAAQTGTTDSMPVVRPSVLLPRQDDSSLRATDEKQMHLRREDSTSKVNQQEGVNSAQLAETASQSVSQLTVEGSSEPATKATLLDLAGAELELYATPPYPKKITHRGITDHAPTRTESLQNALQQLRQERQDAECSPTNLAEKQPQDKSIPTHIAEAALSPHGEVPIANAIAGDLEARRLAPVIRSSDLVSRPSKQGNPLRERGPDYRSLRVSDWQETPISTTSMATATSPSTIQNRFVDVSEQGEEAVATSPVAVENADQFTPPRDESYLAENSSSAIENRHSHFTDSAQNTVHNPYASVVDADSPRLDTKQSEVVAQSFEPNFAHSRDMTNSTENNAESDSEEGYTKIITEPEAPTVNFVFNSRLPGDEESKSNLVSNQWVTTVTSMTVEDRSPQPAKREVSNPNPATQTVPAKNSRSDSPTTEPKEIVAPPTSYRTMTIPSHSRDLIRPGRIVEITSPFSDPKAMNPGDSNEDMAKREAFIDPSTVNSIQDQGHRQALPRRGPVIKPSPRPIAIP